MAKKFPQKKSCTKILIPPSYPTIFFPLILFSHPFHTEKKNCKKKPQKNIPQKISCLYQISLHLFVANSFFLPFLSCSIFPTHIQVLVPNLSMNLSLNLSKISTRAIPTFDSVKSSLVCMCTPSSCTHFCTHYAFFQYLHAHKTYTLKQCTPMFCVHVYIAKLYIAAYISYIVLHREQSKQHFEV